MDFAFPKNKINHNGVIKNLTNSNKYNLIDILNPKDNLINIDKTDYYYTYFSPSGKAKGGNSIILKLYESQRIDLENIEYDTPDLVLKILKFKKSSNPKFPHKAEMRFNKEVAALEKCKDKKFQNIITIFHKGTCGIYSIDAGKYEKYLYYTMEYAPWDLKTYIENNPNLSLLEKISLCLSIAEGINELSTLNYYHRDIKPDNIFIIDGEWKIADLGLMSERSEVLVIDDENEFIGPKGWLSPEAMHKYLCEGKRFTNHFDCSIDHQSDIFQLGRIFCYIIQNNNPIGVFKQKDFFIENTLLYQIVRTMLSYSKGRRYKKIEEVIKLLKIVQKSLLRARD